MYHHIRGTLARKTPAEAVIDVGGVGYRMIVPLSTFEKLPAEGAEVRLLTTLIVRDDAHRLYGFLSAAERDFFIALQGVSGVGPQVALGIVSALTLTEFRAAVDGGEARRLQRVKGVGKRLSERLVVELRDRLGDVAAEAPSGSVGAVDRDAVMALEALGYTAAQAAKAVADVRREHPGEADAGDLVRRALRLL